MQVLLDDYDVASVATDLVNTAPEVAVSTGDGLADPHALHRFLHERRVAPDALAGGRSPPPSWPPCTGCAARCARSSTAPTRRPRPRS